MCVHVCRIEGVHLCACVSHCACVCMCVLAHVFACVLHCACALVCTYVYALPCNCPRTLVCFPHPCTRGALQVHKLVLPPEGNKEKNLPPHALRKAFKFKVGWGLVIRRTHAGVALPPSTSTSNCIPVFNGIAAKVHHLVSATSSHPPSPSINPGLLPLGVPLHPQALSRG